MSVVVVKLGSSIVAEDNGELRSRTIRDVCAQVSELEASNEQIIMVTSGAIARGVRLMGLPSRPQAMDELQAASAVGQGDLFRAYEERLVGNGTHAAQVLLTAGDIAARTNYLNARQTLKRLVQWGVVPVVNENDTTATDEITFGDNDFLAAQVAILLRARLLVLLTDTDGLHTANPRFVPDAELISEVTNADVLPTLNIDDRTSAFGSGGMRSKVAAAEMASEAGIPAVICSGIRPRTLIDAVNDQKVGTRFLAKPSRASNFKLWLKYAKPAKGDVFIDHGASEVLRHQGSSLLAVGIVSVHGRFDAGDAIEVKSEGQIIGKGISAYSSDELQQIKGKKSAAVRELLPNASEEVIHRDRFVLM
jgi:glutamate 5-kinase